LCQNDFSASANPILYQGAIPVLLIVNTNLELMSRALEQAIVSEIAKGKKKPKVIIAVHL
jgi:dTDP-4-amino-4,6-dideoxygalactose transaminase